MRSVLSPCVLGVLLSPLGAQATWQLVQAQQDPLIESIRFPSLVWHDGRGELLLVGAPGEYLPPLHPVHVWRWARDRWVVVDAQGPPHRQLPAIAYDAGRDRIVMYGGVRDGEFSTETWEWSGTWQRIPTPLNPGGIITPAFVYDRARGRSVLVTGRVGRAETWTWDGSAWQLRATQSTPTGVGGWSSAWDAARQQVVLFDGSAGAETWTFDGLDWTRQAPALSPSPRQGGVMAFEPRRGSCILWGGSTIINQRWLLYDETWEWNGATWRQLQPIAAPPTSREDSAAIAYAPSLGRAVIVGLGSADTWQLVPFCEDVGLGHPSGGLALACTSEPVIGGALGLSFPSAAGVAMVVLSPACLPAPAPVGPPLFCAPGAFFPDPGPAFAFPVLGNPARVLAPIPFSFSLLGATACVQGAALQPQSCLRLTQGVRATISFPY
jgi:hypothetical protein